MHPKHIKPQTQRAVKKSVSLPMSLLVDALELQRRERLPSFSDVFQMLLRERLRADDPRSLAAR